LFYADERDCYIKQSWAWGEKKHSVQVSLPWLKHEASRWSRKADKKMEGRSYIFGGQLKKAKNVSKGKLQKNNSRTDKRGSFPPPQGKRGTVVAEKCVGGGKCLTLGTKGIEKGATKNGEKRKREVFHKRV